MASVPSFKKKNPGNKRVIPKFAEAVPKEKTPSKKGKSVKQRVRDLKRLLNKEVLRDAVHLELHSSLNV